MNQHITAIIPARAGSRRIKDKNIIPFNGTTLLEHKIEQLKRVHEITSIVVSSDSDVILEKAERHGVKIHKRAVEYCDEVSRSFGEVVRHICSEVEGEHIAWTTCTSPLVTPAVYSKAIQKYFEVLNCGYDSLTTVRIIKEYFWDKNGPLNYQTGLGHVPSQRLPEWYVITNGLSIVAREKAISYCYVFGKKPYRFKIDKINSVDIDDELDLRNAEAWLPLLDNMKE